MLDITATTKRRRRLLRWLLMVAAVIIALNLVLIQRQTCRTGGPEQAVSLHWGVTGTLSRTCGAQPLGGYMLEEQWPALLGVVFVLATGALALRFRGRRI